VFMKPWGKDPADTGRPGPPSTRVIALTKQEAKRLRRLIRAGTTENRVAIRCRIVLLRAADTPVLQIARLLDISYHRVHPWCDRFLEKRIVGLHDLPRSGRPRSLSLESNASP